MARLGLRGDTLALTELWASILGVAVLAHAANLIVKRIILRIVALVGVVACAVMVVTGAVATASGPHPGADQDVHRLGLGIRDTVYVHVRATAVFGIGLLLVGWQLLRARRTAPGVVRLALALLGVLLVQMLVGEIQYRNALPWGLVLVPATTPELERLATARR